MGVGVRLVDVMNIVGGNQADSQLARQFHQRRIGLFLLRDTMILNLDEKMIRAKDVDVFPGGRLRSRRIPLQNQRRNLAGDTGAQADQSFMVGCQ